MQLPEKPANKADSLKIDIIKIISDGDYDLIGNYRYLIDVDGEKFYVSASTKEPFFTISKKLDSKTVLALGYKDKLYFVPYSDISTSKPGITSTDGQYRVRFNVNGDKLILDNKKYYIESKI